MSEFDRAKCAQRNRLAARRDGAEGMPVRLFRESASPAAADSALQYAHGTLPATPEAALERINALLPEGAPALTADSVYVHYMEAANDNFVGDRYMFMDGSTLRNIAHDAAAGVAFMNSHRDGGLSHPAELPMGKTFAGRYEHYQNGHQRALVGFYMLRGVAPNGANAPSTDDLHATITGGTTADTSVGLFGGDNICDVCANPVDDYELCSHDPGTSHNMTPAERTAQTARGVTQGRASYTLTGAHMGEVSAVYDGAVPGAGFRKTLALARRHVLSRAELTDARQVYARLLRKGDLPMDDIVEAVEQGMSKALARFGRNRVRTSSADGDDLEAMLAPVQLQGQAFSPVTDAERTALAAERAALAAEKAAFAKDRFWASAEADVTALLTAGHVLPAQNQPAADGKPALVALFAAAYGDDAGGVALFAQSGGSRVAALKAVFSAAPAHSLTTAVVPKDGQILAAATAPSDNKLTPERRAELLNYTEMGQKALARQNGHN